MAFDDGDRTARPELATGSVAERPSVQEKLEESERQRRRLARELQHRVKNILASIRSLANLTFDESSDLAGFHERFDGRLQALCRFQASLGFGSNASVDLKELIVDEFLAHAARLDRDVKVEGPDLALEPRAAQAFALVIHELTSHAVHHGALASEAGRISVTWRLEHIDGTQTLALEWHETGVQASEDMRRSAFGKHLIEAVLPYELGGSARIEQVADDYRCIVEIPCNDQIRPTEQER